MQHFRLHLLLKIREDIHIFDVAKSNKTLAHGIPNFCGQHQCRRKLKVEKVIAKISRHYPFKCYVKVRAICSDSINSKNIFIFRFRVIGDQNQAQSLLKKY